MIVSALLSLVNIGSSAALNAIDSLGANSILFSYTITIGCLVWRRLRGAPLPPRRWSLGKYGLTVNIVSILFVAPIWFFNFWPLTVPVTPESM
jgi:amino acid transporter